MNLKCPCCHAKFSIEQLTQDEAARELLTMRPTLLPSMMPYLTLFRSGKRDLAFDKALQLIREVVELSADLHQLETALGETVRAIRNKRDEGQFKALKDHKYLMRVLESTPASNPSPLPLSGEGSTFPHDKGGPRGVSKTATAIGKLQAWKNS